MDGYGIMIDTERLGTSRYRLADGETGTWELPEAEEIAYNLLKLRHARYVTFGNGEHEFRMWGDNVTDYGNFNHPHIRWSDWFVDVEINGRRWRYRPVADLDGYEAADELGGAAANLYPDVTRVWTGASDGSEEYETELDGQ